MKRRAVLLLILAALTTGAYGETAVTVHAVGDVMIGTLFPAKNLPPKNGGAIFEFVKSYLTNGNPDIVLGNLEGAVTHYPQTIKRIRPGYTYAFRMPPENMKYLSEAGFNVMTTANNHARDFDERGYRDTGMFLELNGIRSVGRKNEILKMVVNGRSVAVIAFGWFTWGNNVNNIQESMKLIRSAKESNDIVILSVHSGGEGEGALHVKDRMETFLGETRGNPVRFCHEAVDNGADLIIGHGPHVPRAVEVYKNRLIAYSLGNFATYGMATQGHKKFTLILRAELGTNGNFLGGRIVPMMQVEGGAYNGIPKYDPQGRTIRLIQELSDTDFKTNGAMIDADGVIRPN